MKDFDLNTVSYLSKYDNKEILVIYDAGDCDTFTYTKFKKVIKLKNDVLCRTEHLDVEEINFLLKKLGV